jgi:tetratricopeptide (TPR) repeat protein
MPRRLAFGLLLLLCGPAAWADDLADCNQMTDLDRRIRGCTNLIGQGKFQGSSLAVLHDNRGLAYGAKGDLDRAIADHAKAIEIDPADATARYHRGLASAMKGAFDAAIADFSKAVELNPKLAPAYYNRGASYGMMGDDRLHESDRDRSPVGAGLFRPRRDL